MTRFTLPTPKHLSFWELLNDCVRRFDYIQFSHSFGVEDFENCQLKLDVVRLRLRRWADTVIHNGSNFDDKSDSETQAHMTLELLQLSFEAAKMTSKRHEIRLNQGSCETMQEGDLQQLACDLHQKLRNIDSQTQRQNDTATKVMLTFYKIKDFNSLLEGITKSLTDLEELLPIDAALRQAERDLIKNMDKNKLSLWMLEDAAAGTDQFLFEATSEKLEHSYDRNHVGQINENGRGRVHIGDTFTDATQGYAHRRVFRGPGGNSAGSVTARGSSVVQIGNQYGGRGIFH